MKSELIIVGAFNEVIELANENGYTIRGCFDNTKRKEYFGVPILGTDEQATQLFPALQNIPIIVSIDKPALRADLVKYYLDIGYKFTRLISKNSKVSSTAEIGEGSIVQFMVNISSECEIASHVRLNTYCNIMHNADIGCYTTIAPNAVILGNVKIGSFCYIGANSTILPNISIADNVIIGAGSIVTKNIDVPGTYLGAPAKLKK